jgi:hypothetical protein
MINIETLKQVQGDLKRRRKVKLKGYKNNKTLTRISKPACGSLRNSTLSQREREEI